MTNFLSGLLWSLFCERVKSLVVPGGGGDGSAPARYNVSAARR